MIMDMKGVSLIQTKNRTINTGGKLVIRIRNYLDKETNILRVVLDLEPSKSYIVRPRHDAPKNSYMITIYEDTSLSKKRPGGSGDTKGSLASKEKQITILRPDLRPEEQQEGKPREATTSQEKLSVARDTKAPATLDHGRSQMNAGDFAAAIETFTLILTVYPQDSLCYRLRGNAYDNLGNRQKALEDWTQAARLGDTTIQSFLDHLGVNWRKNSAPENRNVAKTPENAQSLLEQGKSQLNDGEFVAAVGIFTLILSTNPQDSLVYRLRGDAYDNLGDQRKAVEDWTQAARLGDHTMQSYLDSQGVKWREKLTP